MAPSVCKSERIYKVKCVSTKKVKVKCNAPLSAPTAPVERSGTFLYLMTIKCNHMEYTSREKISLVYSRLLRQLKSYELSDNRAWELDTDSRWHLHFIIALPREPFYKRLQVTGYSVHFRRFHIDDYPNVVAYLKKVNQNPIHLDQMDVYSLNKFDLLSLMD